MGERERCEVLVFLGFAFHPLNMRLLIPSGSGANIGRVLATGKGMSPESQNIVRRELSEIFARGEDDRVSIVNGTCSELFFDHHRFLSGEVEYERPFEMDPE